MRSSRRYGRRIRETPQEVIHHALWRADPYRLGRWLFEEYGPDEAAALVREVASMERFSPEIRRRVDEILKAQS